MPSLENEPMQHMAIVTVHGIPRILRAETLEMLHDKIDIEREKVEEGYPNIPWQGTMEFFVYRPQNAEEELLTSKRRETDLYSIPNREAFDFEPEVAIKCVPQAGKHTPD